MGASLEAILGETLKIDDYHVADSGDRPTLPHNGYDERSESIPCFDLRSLRVEPRRVEFLGAVREWGFFQLTGHGVEEEVVNDVVEMAYKVFEMPLEKKLKAAPSKESPSGYLCGVLKKEGNSWVESLHSWADPDDFSIAADKLWLQADEAQTFKDAHHKYALAMEKLGTEILELLEEALGVKNSGFSGKWERMKRTFVRFNYYPPCEEPENVLGAGVHTDPSIITILHQDDIGGLQIFKDGRWIACKPKPGALVVNIGDCLQVLSNDILPSVQHRACLNRNKARLSIATFAFPKAEEMIEPCSELVDEQNVARFRSFQFHELTDASKATRYKGKQVLSQFKADANA